jgi:hypothetical protein
VGPNQKHNEKKMNLKKGGWGLNERTPNNMMNNNRIRNEPTIFFPKKEKENLLIKFWNFTS